MASWLYDEMKLSSKQWKNRCGRDRISPLTARKRHRDPFTKNNGLAVTSIIKCRVIFLYFPKRQRYTVEVWQWISNFISHLTGLVFTYPCWDKSSSMAEKEDPGSRLPGWTTHCRTLSWCYPIDVGGMIKWEVWINLRQFLEYISSARWKVHSSIYATWIDTECNTSLISVIPSMPASWSIRKTLFLNKGF